MSIQKIFHLADIHIRNYHLHDHYRKILNTLLQRLTTLSEDLPPEEIRVVIVGDLFHQKISVSNEQTLFAAWFLNKLSKIGKVIIIPGNHDFLENNHGRLDSITPVVNLIQNENVVYYREAGVYEDDDVNWVVYSLYSDNKRPDFAKTQAKKYIGLFHGPIIGCKTNMGYEFEDGYDKSIFNELDIVLCGDIHSHQILEENETKIIMVGSLIQQNYGENVKMHGFVIYNMEDDSYDFEEVENDSPFLKFKITDINDIESGAEQLVNLG